jgi:hypothetical protein
MEKILQKYNQLCQIQSDINEHLPVIKKYAEECEHITEMGVRYVVSTWAFLASKPKKIIAYDILTGLDMNLFNHNLNEITNAANEIGVSFTFQKEDVLNIEIEETDLLFIDTYHEYKQIKNELRLHGNKSKKYLMFHDTTTFAQFGEGGREPNPIGIWPAIEEFLEENKHWELCEKLENNNGFTILKRIN